MTDLRAAAEDALAGWRYIRKNHGDLYGVGWDRVEDALAVALASVDERAERQDPAEGLGPKDASAVPKADAHPLTH